LKALFSIFILLLLSLQISFAQIPDFARNPTANNNGSNSSSTTSTSLGDYKIIFPDSLPVHYFYASNPDELFSLKDTLLDNFQHYEPTRQVEYFDYITLGEIGHPHKPLLYQPIIREGVDLGFHQFDLYMQANDKVRFFKNPKPYTEAYYSATTSQEELLMKAIASIDLSKQIKGAIDYRRINHAAQYKNSNNRHTNFSISAWYESKSKRHKVYASYLANTILQKNNGGLVDIDAIQTGGTFASRSLASVNLENAQTEYYKKEITLTNYFYIHRLAKPNTDNSASNAVNLLAMHQISYDRTIHKFFDSSPADDTLVYGDLMIDSRGLRNYVNYHKVENEFKIRLEYNGQLDVGLKHKVFFLRQEPQDTVLNNLFLIGKWHLQTKNDRFGLQAKAHFGLLDNGGDYLADGRAYLSLDKLGRLDVRLMSQRYSPTLMHYRLFISQQEIWNNSFAKPIETSLMASYFLPKTKTTLHFQNHLINNLIYFDTLAMPKQADNAVNVIQFLVNQNFKRGSFHLDNTIGVQQISNTDILRHPSFVSKHSIYFEGYVFKKAALARLGLDVRYNTNYFADNYQPATGQFYIQNDKNITSVPLIDAFLSFKIQTFRAFVKAENLNELIWGSTYTLNGRTFFVDTPIHMEYAPNYASRGTTIRFGIHWRFYD
jgi:hypothetical protein